MKVHAGNKTIELLKGDITEQHIDAIVNAANTQLILGGGVAGAIRAKGGPIIQNECSEIGHTNVGNAAITSAGRLNAKYVIHAVGPKMGEGNEEEKLKNATLNSLKLADEYKLKSICFPAISTGIFGYPIKSCAEIMLKTVKDYLLLETQLQTVVFCLFDSAGYDTFMQILEKLK